MLHAPKFTNKSLPAPANVLLIVQRRKKTIALCTLLALGLAAVYCVVVPPLYESKAQLLVIQKRPDVVTSMDTRALLPDDDYLATHQALLSSPRLIDRAIKKEGVAGLKGLPADKEERNKAILQAMTLSRIKNSGKGPENILNLSFRWPDTDQPALFLDALITSYREFLDETYRQNGQEAIKLITAARDVTQKELAEKEAAYRKFQKDTPVLLWKGKEAIGLRQERLASIDKKRAALMIRKAELNGQLEALNATGKDRETMLAMIDTWSTQSDGLIATTKTPQMNLKEQLYPLLMEEQKMLQTHGIKSPEVEGIRKRIEITRSFLAGAAASPDPVEQYRRFCLQQLQHCDATQKLLTELFDKEHASARELTAFEMEDEGYRADIERRQKLHESLIKQMQHIDLAKDMVGYEAQTIAPPTSGKKVRPNLLLIFPGALIVGLLAGLLLGYVAEMRDHSFRSADEVSRYLGVPIVGQVPLFRPTTDQKTIEVKNLDPMLCTFYDPDSAEGQAYHDMCAGLSLGVPGPGGKLIQVASPAKEDGKTVLAANLAVALARSGKRTLLVDANLRHPRQDRVFSLEAKPGLAAVLAGQTEAQNAIQASGIEGLSVLPCGPRPSNPAELLLSPRMEQTLQRLREQFDFVIVDTPALVGLTDSRLIASNVDGMLLGVRVGISSRTQAERAMELLSGLKAPVLGVVVAER